MRGRESEYAAVGWEIGRGSEKWGGGREVREWVWKWLLSVRLRKVCLCSCVNTGEITSQVEKEASQTSTQTNMQTDTRTDRQT